MKKLLTSYNFLLSAGIIMALGIAMVLPHAGLGALLLLGQVSGQPVATRIKSLSEDRGVKLRLMDDLINLMQKESRNLTTLEQDNYNRLKREVEELTKEIDQLTANQDSEMRSAKSIYGSPIKDEEERTIQILKRVAPDKERPITDFIVRNYDIDQDIQKANVYRVLRSLATGKTYDKATTKALDEVRSVTGTALLNPYLSAQVWDGSLPLTVLAKCGMRVQPLETTENKIAQVSTYPTFEWLAQSASSTTRTVALTARTFTTRTLRGWFNVPGELLQDGLNIERALKDLSSKAAAMQIDKAGLIGAGSATEPEGIREYSGLNEYSMGNNGGTLSDYAPFAEVLKLIQDDNGTEPNAAIMAPRTMMTINKFVEGSTNAPLRAPDFLQNVKMFQTSNIPTTEDQGTATGVCSSIFFGDFTSLYMGVRMDIMVEVGRFEKETFEYPFFLGFRGDFLPEREQNFGRIKGIKIS